MDVTEGVIPWRRFRTALFAVIAGIAAQTLWAAGPRIALDIPAGEFSKTVIEFSRQTNVEVIYVSPSSIANLRTPAVSGQLEIEEALTRLLAGTGFTFEFENPRSVLLKRAEAPGDAAAAAQAGAAGEGPVVETRADAMTLASITSGAEPQQQDVVVTGSYIHGVLDIMSPLVRVTRDEMKATPYATVHDALMSLTINSGGGFSDDFAGNTGNYNRGTASNLRGLGYGSTLVLVNGRRQPLAGSAADFVDLSNIPWSAVERIEVLPDGSSALYGSDAIAGVVNIILREDVDGAVTQGRWRRALNFTDVRQPLEYRKVAGFLSVLRATCAGRCGPSVCR